MKLIPNHLGVILDGNRRWAKEKGLPFFKGYEKGVKVAKKIIKWAKDRGIRILTLFIFSSENWNRSKIEINYLMKLIKKSLKEYKKNIKEICREGLKIKFIGQKERIPKDILKDIQDIEELTRNNKKMIINLAFNYGGRAEIVDAIKKIIQKKIPPEKINEKIISENLWTSDVDLIIRTGKEQRISNFLIWQAAYSELYFCPKYWPDFNEKDLDKALLEYSLRQRRFGK